jgi:hypothetical protein
MNHMFSEYSKISSMYRVRTGSKQGAYLTRKQSYVFIPSSCKAINIHYIIMPFGAAMGGWRKHVYKNVTNSAVPRIRGFSLPNGIILAICAHAWNSSTGSSALCRWSRTRSCSSRSWFASPAAVFEEPNRKC